MRHACRACQANPNGWTYAIAGFVQGTSIPTLGEVLAAGPQVQRRWHSLSLALARCRTATITIAGKKARATIQPLPFPQVASTSSAYAWAFADRGDPDRHRPCPFPGREIRGLSRLLRPGTALGCDGAGVRERSGGQGGEGIDRSRQRRGLDRVRAGADRAHQLGTVAYRAAGSGPPWS